MNTSPQFSASVTGDGRIGVVVVTFHPAGEFEGRLAAMSAQGGALVVVDNGSKAAVRRRLAENCSRHGWHLIQNPTNRGVGAALNQGVSRLAALGFDWALLFDQDSEPLEGMRERIKESLQRHPQSGRVALVGASFQERATGRCHRVLCGHPRFPLLFRKIEPMEQDLPDVSCVITSGSMVRMAAIEALGGFDEAFFIDYVDTDFCLRGRERGWMTMVSATAQFVHESGQRDRRRWHGIELQPTHHSALRHYYMARNRVPMWRRHALAVPHWAMFDLCFAIYNGFRVFALESDRWRKFKAMVLGTWDGLCGVTGPCPERRRRMFDGQD